MIGLNRRSTWKFDTYILMRDGHQHCHAVTLAVNRRHRKQLWTTIKRSGRLPGQRVPYNGSEVVQSSFKWVRYPPPWSCSVPTLCWVSVDVRACFLYSCYPSTRIRVKHWLLNWLTIISGYPKLPLLTSFSGTVFWSIFISKVASLNSPDCFNRLVLVSDVPGNPSLTQFPHLASTVHDSDAIPIQNWTLVHLTYGIWLISSQISTTDHLCTLGNLLSCFVGPDYWLSLHGAH